MNHRTRSYLLFVLLIGCICYLVSHFVVQLYFVNGSSMEPTYTSGQPVLLQKFGLPDCLDYNDVVVIRHETLGRESWPCREIRYRSQRESSMSMGFPNRPPMAFLS